MNAKFGDDLCKHWTYVFMGYARPLIAFWDNNSITIDGPTRLAVSDIEIERFRASGWHVQEIDGHDTDAIRDAIAPRAVTTSRHDRLQDDHRLRLPDQGRPQKAHSDPGEEEIAGAKILGWDSPFVILTAVAEVARDRRKGPSADRVEGAGRIALRVRAPQ